MAIPVSAPATSTRRIPGAFPIFHPATEPAPAGGETFRVAAARPFPADCVRAARRSGSPAAVASDDGTVSAAWRHAPTARRSASRTRRASRLRRIRRAVFFRASSASDPAPSTSPRPGSPSPSARFLPEPRGGRPGEGGGTESCAPPDSRSARQPGQHVGAMWRGDGGLGECERAAPRAASMANYRSRRARELRGRRKKKTLDPR